MSRDLRRIALALLAALAAACAGPPPQSSVVPGTIGMSVRQSGAAVVVSALRPGGPAERAGVRPGDVLKAYDGVAVTGLRQFRRLVLDTPPGSEVRITLERGRETRTLDLRIEELDLAPLAGLSSS